MLIKPKETDHNNNRKGNQITLHTNTTNISTAYKDFDCVVLLRFKSILNLSIPSVDRSPSSITFLCRALYPGRKLHQSSFSYPLYSTQPTTFRTPCIISEATNWQKYFPQPDTNDLLFCCFFRNLQRHNMLSPRLSSLPPSTIQFCSWLQCQLPNYIDIQILQNSWFNTKAPILKSCTKFRLLTPSQ